MPLRDMSLIDILERAKTLELSTEDGESVELEFLAPMSEAEIASFEDTLGGRLPPDVRELLAYARGFELNFAVEFTGANEGIDVSDFVPKYVSLAADDCGNHWIVDLTEDASKWDSIYFACHDAPVLLYQCRGLETFLNEIIKMNVAPHKSLIDDVHEDKLFEVWIKNPGLVSQADALTSEDDEMRAFAAQLDGRWFIKDLRRPMPGDGFSWGRFGPRGEVCRFGKLPMFAIRQPEPGFLGKLFGRK
jgi:cell wall assembly regulator SMI1